MLKFEGNFPMSNVTTLQIGGPAKKFVIVKTQAELVEAIQSAEKNQLPYLVIGGGSNLLVNDKGINSLVIKNEIKGIKLTHLRGVSAFFHLGGVMVTAKSGTLLQDLVDYTISQGFSGLHKLTGIPGTVGGAVYGNAGAYGQTISDNILSVVVLSDPAPYGAGESKDLSQLRVTLSKNECRFNYRDSIFKKNHAIPLANEFAAGITIRKPRLNRGNDRYTILEITFQLKSADPRLLQQEAEEVLSKRLVKYPPGIKCPGSFFKNLKAAEIPQQILRNLPQEIIVFGKVPAGGLLQSVGARGQKLDGIEIASYHANLFINKGSGTAKAFCQLAKTYALKVKEKFNITLEPEVQLINLPSVF